MCDVKISIHPNLDSKIGSNSWLQSTGQIGLSHENYPKWSPKKKKKSPILLRWIISLSLRCTILNLNIDIAIEACILLQIQIKYLYNMPYFLLIDAEDANKDGTSTRLDFHLNSNTGSVLKGAVPEEAPWL